MKCIVISLPVFFDGEASAISAMLSSGIIDRVHIRKPSAGEDAMRRLIEEIPSSLHGRLSLHDCHSLAGVYSTGIHLNSRNPAIPEGFTGLVSCSCHRLDESVAGADYRFLSPIFDSISKPGYRAAFSLENLRGKIDRSFIALGGVRPSNLPQLAEVGFGGAAFLGYIWNGNLIEKLNDVAVYNSQTRSIR